MNTLHQKKPQCKKKRKNVVYKSRWIILFVQCLLNVANYMIFISYAPAANYVNDYYQNKNMTNLMSMTFLAVSIPSMIVGMYFVDRIGIRIMIIGSSFLNCAGGAIRILSTVDHFDNRTKLILAVLGQAVSACANPATFFLNTKVPSIWFPISQRALATALATCSAELGMLVISLLSSFMVKSTSDLFKLNVIVFIPSLLTFILALIGIHRSVPLSSPSLSSNRKPLDPLTGLKKLLKNPSYIILVVSLASGLAIFNTYYTTMEETLCGRGYDNDFNAICTSVLIVGGLAGATIAGAIADRTKLFEEILKICLCLANLVGLVFTEFVIHLNMKVPIAVSVCIYGFFGVAFYAVGMEMSAEITYPVSETLSAGIVGLCGQIFGVTYLTVWGLLTRPLPDQYRNIQQCTFSGQTLTEDSLVEQDTIIPLYLFIIVGTLIAMASVIFFKPKYQRLLLERKKHSIADANVAQENSNPVVIKF